MRGSLALFGDNPVAARLPNVIRSYLLMEKLEHLLVFGSLVSGCVCGHCDDISPVISSVFYQRYGSALLCGLMLEVRLPIHGLLAALY